MFLTKGPGCVNASFPLIRMFGHIPAAWGFRTGLRLGLGQRKVAGRRGSEAALGDEVCAARGRLLLE